MTKRWPSLQLLVAYPCLKGYWIKPQYILCKEQNKVDSYSEMIRKGYYCTVPPLFSHQFLVEKEEKMYIYLWGGGECQYNLNSAVLG